MISQETSIHFEDIRCTLPTNDDCPAPLQAGWWRRELEDIVGLTFHHTLSYSPWATAAHYIRKGGGRPSIPYTLWICGCGMVLQCGNFRDGCWHDHTGHRNVHLSVGLAGTLHKYRPTVAQLDAAAAVAAWAVCNPDFNISRDQVRGHSDYTATICPGWEARASGYWRHDLMAEVLRLLS